MFNNANVVQKTKAKIMSVISFTSEFVKHPLKIDLETTKKNLNIRNREILMSC